LIKPFDDVLWQHGCDYPNTTGATA
jgi:hypothetical protein